MRGPVLNRYFCQQATGELPPLKRPDGKVFSSGRGALFWLLNALSVQPGDSVLLPAFIAEGVVSPIKAAGATCCFYKLDASMMPDLADLAVQVQRSHNPRLAVVYHPFGYAAPVADVRHICAPWGVPVLEDCAHAFFSATEQHSPLGLIGDYALFSYNKFFPVSDGAELTIMGGAQSDSFLLPPSEISLRHYQVHLNYLKKFAAITPSQEAGSLLKQAGAAYDKYYAMLNSDVRAREMSLRSRQLLGRFCISEMQQLRRKNVEEVYDKFSSQHLSLHYRKLPDGIAPFAVPMRCDPTLRQGIVDAAFQKGLHLANLSAKWDFIPEFAVERFGYELEFLRSNLLLPISEHLTNDDIKVMLDIVKTL